MRRPVIPFPPRLPPYVKPESWLFFYVACKVNPPGGVSDLRVLRNGCQTAKLAILSEHDLRLAKAMLLS